jgi:hypothetical protein
MSKQNNLSVLIRILTALFISMALFAGCAQGFEGDALSGAQSGRSVLAPPATLVNTDWYYEDSSGSYVLGFRNNGAGNRLNSNISQTAFTYTYASGTGTIIIGGSTWDITVDGNDMEIDDGTETLEATELTAQDDDLTGFVGNTITPAKIYSSIDFVDGSAGEDGTAQMVFGDGTFPTYTVIFYDGVSAGLIERLGLFYLEDTGSGNYNVVFPYFYTYHSTPVIYEPSAEVLATLVNTTWSAQGITEKVVFGVGTADFTGDYESANLPYVYDDRQSGAAGVYPLTQPYPGSFLVEGDEVSGYTMTFFNWLDKDTEVTFTKNP